MVKYIILAIVGMLCLMSCSSAMQKNSAERDMDIYLAIGQSNMAGRAEIRLEDMGPIENVFLSTDNEKEQWEPAANPLNKYSTIRKNIGMQRLGPAFSFARSMHEAEPNKKIGLVVNAKGGTKIVQWLPGTHFYKEAVRRTRIAMKNGTLKGIIWHQGESDCDELRRTFYLERLEVLVNGLREAFNDPDLPFVLGEVYKTENRAEFNKLLSKVPGFIKNSALVNSDNTHAADNTHFDAPSTILMGNRYAEAMLQLQNGEK